MYIMSHQFSLQWEEVCVFLLAHCGFRILCCWVKSGAFLLVCKLTEYLTNSNENDLNRMNYRLMKFCHLFGKR